jgi:hypothetical protein
MSDDTKVVEFHRPSSIEDESAAERDSRLRTLVAQRARQPAFERVLYLDDDAKKHNIPPAKLKELIDAVVKENEKKARATKAEQEKREQRVEKKQTTARREQRRESERQAREERREQERADREARDRQRERDRELTAISRLPRAEHESRLVALAARLGEDLECLRDEFAQFVSTEEVSVASGDVEPWPEPVSTETLLTEVMVQVRRYVVFHDDATAVATILWIAYAWVHNETAVHSTMLLIKSAEGDSGKTTLCGTIRFVTPRSYAGVELTGPSLYRLVDSLQPTLIIDDADDLLGRKPDLAHIINASWTSGTKVPRIIHGVEHWFDPFCPKVVAGVNPRMPPQTRSRYIDIRLVPKLPHERVEEFNHADDEHLLALRRKLTRWAADNKAAIKDAQPEMSGFNNRLRMNWKLLFAIADLAGDDWPKRARAAAVKLARKREDPSEGKRLLAALRPMVATREEIASAEIVKRLIADPTGEWVGFRHRGPITQREVAALLKDYEIFPEHIHPTKRGDLTVRGYKTAPIREMIRRHLQQPDLPVEDPHIRTSRRKRSIKRRKK